MRIMAVSHSCVTDVNQQFYMELESLGHQVHLIVPSNFRTEYGKAKVTRWPDFKGTIEQRRIGVNGSIPLHFYQSNLRPAILNYKPDVLYVEEEPYSISAWQSFYASRGLPMMRVTYSCQNIYKRYPEPFRSMERYVLSQADMAAVISDEVGSVLLKKEYKGKLLPFPLGPNTAQFRPLPDERLRIRADIGAADAFVIGYAGRFVEEKGLQTLIEALPELADLDVKLLLIGNGPLREELERARQRHPGSIIIEDQVQHRDIHKWMSAMDVLALPSLTKPNWKEQFGRVILEAMACKVPVIGSDSGEIPRLIRDTGGGWDFPEGNAAAFADRVRSLHANKAERSIRAEQGYRSVHAKYSKRALAIRFAEELENAVAAPAGRL